MAEKEPNEYRTLDGSWIRELVRPESEGSVHLSVAEAIIAPGETTLRHRHRTSEEVYYILAGEGLVEVGGKARRVMPGMAVLIPVGVEHCARCMDSEPLRILCTCSPPYRHEDTELTEGQWA